MAETFPSMKALSESKGIPVDVLRQIKKIFPEPFAVNGHVKWHVLEPWMREHEEELAAIDEDKYFKFRGERMEAEAGLSHIALEKARGNVLDKTESEETVRKIAAAQKAIFKQKLVSELPPKLLGLNVTDMSVIMDRTVNEICQLMQNLKL